MSKKAEKSPKKKNTAENKNKKRHSFSFSKLIYNDKYLFALSRRCCLDNKFHQRRLGGNENG